jgi:hypothetical protein
MKRFRISVTATTVFLLLCGVSARAALLTNGSFETPVVPAGSFQLFFTGGSFTGWSVVGATGNVGIVSGTFTQNGISFPAEDGSQWLDLTGLNSNSATGVQQTVATTPGTTYDLSFFVGNVVNPGGIFGTTSTVRVLVNGTLLLSATNSQGGTTLTWEKFSQVFTASSSSTTITFLNGDLPSGFSNGLDNIVLTAVPASVPEPSASLLLALGLAGVLGYGWRRKRVA